jgi:hypothetical protein
MLERATTVNEPKQARAVLADEHRSNDLTFTLGH